VTELIRTADLERMRASRADTDLMFVFLMRMLFGYSPWQHCKQPSWLTVKSGRLQPRRAPSTLRGSPAHTCEEGRTAPSPLGPCQKAAFGFWTVENRPSSFWHHAPRQIIRLSIFAGSQYAVV
jgi:hypothetical protein